MPIAERECPKCGAFMEHQQDEPDVGIVGGWVCHECEYSELDELDDSTAA